jgi:hypothetical protein
MIIKRNKKRKIDFSLNVKEGHVSRLSVRWEGKKTGRRFLSFEMMKCGNKFLRKKNASDGMSKEG